MNVIDEKEKDLFIRYGSAASEAMFDFPCKFFQIPDCIGIIPYREENHCAVVFGEPICPPNETAQLADAFHKFCLASNLNIIYVIVGEKFAKWARSCHDGILIEVCEELIFDPNLDLCRASNRLRNRIEKAVKHGLTFHEYIPFNAEIENSMLQIGSQWQKSIKGPNVYLGHLNFFENYRGKRWFYVKDREQVTSMIMLSKIEACKGWLLKFLVTKQGAFRDTSEFLMTSVLDVLRKENCHFLSKGMVPINHLGEIQGLGFFSTWLARCIYKIISSIYKFKKRKEYWLRYNPKEIPVYLLFCRPHIGLNEIRALEKTFKRSHSLTSPKY